MRFVKAVWKLLVGVKDALVLLFMLLFFGLLYAGLSARPPAISEGVLAMDLDGVLVEQASRPDPFTALAGAGSLTCSVGGVSTTLVDGLADFVLFKLPGSSGAGQGMRYAALLISSATLRDGVSSSVLDQWKNLSGKTRSSDQYLYQISQGSVALRNLMP